MLIALILGRSRYSNKQNFKANKQSNSEMKNFALASLLAYTQATSL